MSMRIKLIIIGICIVVVFIIGTININQKINGRKTEDHNFITVEDNIITKAEALRLLSYLYYDKAAREALTFDITYEDSQMSGWYDTYVNAAYHMGLIDKDITENPGEALTYGKCKSLMDNLILKEPGFQSIYQGLTFEFTNQDKDMATKDFLEIYQAILSDPGIGVVTPKPGGPTISPKPGDPTVTPKPDDTIASPKPGDTVRKTLLKEETLLVLGKDASGENPGRMITDQGKYYYTNSADYIKYLSPDPASQEEKDNLTAGEQQGNSDTGEKKGASTAGEEKDDPAAGQNGEQAAEEVSDLAERYLDQGIKALTCGQEIVYIWSLAEEEITLHNVWIKQGEASTLEVFVSGLDKTFTTQYKLSDSLQKVVGDITIKAKKVVQLSVKPDMIQGKVLRIGDGFIEIEGYGKLPMDENMKIYNIYSTLSEEPSTSILVGYENTSFIVSEGKVSAALITGMIKAENIRVLLMTTNYKDIYHSSVKLTGTGKFTVTAGGTAKTYKKGDVVTIEAGDELLKQGRITVEPVAEEGKIRILSIKRTSGNPWYRGHIEISGEDQGLILVNELPLEEYLYAVIPSEMPTSYGPEALKVQALCARSYAYKQLLSNGLSRYGAHVDDSTSYQVYNNIAENENSILAVKETYGQVIEYQGEVISAYYFSTSSGHTAGVSEVWINGNDLPYLEGKLLVSEGGQGSEGEGSEDMEQYADLSSEESFRSFIKAKGLPTTDSEFNWYRWEVTLSAQNLKKVIDANLKKRYEANPEMILTKVKDDGQGKEGFISQPVDTVGSIVDIQVVKRESSGIVSEILIVGSEGTVKVRSEYNIRTMLAPLYDEIVRQDGSSVEKMSLLPSSFFALDVNKKNDKLASITLNGGGYGHGAGLSQNGVKALAEQGKKYEEIAAYFYKDTDIGFIYE
ncbi:MAG TPA: SpoIID/LytB domain-containing protein [Clostridiales bacterium]|nr:SpoIID/LytB domain-containing protein [Clostridiales bacterium]